MKFMLETFKATLTYIRRGLFHKIKQSPILYFFFSSMVVFSIVMFAFLTLFLMKTEADVNLLDVFYGLFFIFFMKSTADFHTHFVNSPYLSYPFSTQVSQTRTIVEIFFAIFVINIGVWVSFSGLYLVSLSFLGVDIAYPVEFLLFSVGVIIGILLGCSVAVHFFSSLRYRLLPTIILLGCYWFSQNMLFIALTLPLAVLHLSWSLRHAMPSYQFVKRKERIKEKAQVKIRDVLPTLFHREITVLWRDRLLFSFIFTSISTAIFTGYLAIYGTDLLIPESLKEYAGEFLPDMFVFLGLYIVVIYTSVFPSLNLFLNEEKTMWILRNLPLTNETIVKGKVLSLVLCFVTALPFLAYISIFIGLDNIIFLTWLLVFSFIAGIIVSVPLGAKYVGKKSDILLLYSIAMILFAILGTAGSIGNIINKSIEYASVLWCLILIIEVFVLLLSLKLSSHILSLK